VRRSVCSIALLLVCLEWKPNSYDYRTQLPSISKLQHYLIKGERSRGDYMVGSHLAALVLEGVHSLCSPSVTVFAEFQQSFARVLAEFYFRLFSGEAVFAPGIPRNKSLDSGGVFDG
jgi:hypothetical protein